MKKVLKYLMPYKVMYFAAAILIMFATLANLALPGIMKNIINVGISNKNTSYIMQQGVLMLLLTLFNLLCWVLSSYFDAKASFYFARDLRKNVFSNVIDSSISQIDKIGISSLINRTSNDIFNLEFSTFRIIRMGVIAPFTCIGGIILSFETDSKISLIFILAALILSAICYIVINKATPLYKAIFPKTDNVNRVIRENLVGIKVVRAFNKINDENKRFDNVNNDLANINIKAQRILAWHSPLITLIMNITIIGILYFGAIRIDKGNFLPGELIAMTQYAALILGAFVKFSMIFQMLPRYITAGKRVSKLLDVKSNNESLNNKEIDVIENAEDLNDNYDIKFDNVSFSYGSAQKSVIDNVSFVVERGKTTAIIGGTGSGKSTLLQLLLRFYEVEKGKIKIGNVDIKNMSKNALRSCFGYVSQKTELFTGTIYQNISYGCKNITVQEIENIVEISQSKSFISSKEHGLNTNISQDGKNFSGGQKQRLTIARALARKAKILLFDDSFSALDFKTDSLIRKSIKQNYVDSTIIIVAQRIATVMDADKIIVLNEGKIEDIGTHFELMNRCNFYKELALSQLSKEEVL